MDAADEALDARAEEPTLVDLLMAILAKLDSIESRLERLEKRR